jgi:hypothetical protein
MTGRMARTGPVLAGACLVAGWLAGGAGCVVEERSRPPRAGALAPQGGRERAELPEGPIAQPARGSTLSTHVRVAVSPLGMIEYDGQTLPLTSPDGRFAACQTGRSPTWDTLLAGPAGEVPGRSEIAIYTLGEDDSGRLRRVELAEPLPPGLVLGRAADDAGFLVESPRPDGSRWIGQVKWLSGRLSWFVQTEDVCAHAVYGPEGSLVYTRRAVGADGSALVLRLADGAESELASGGSYAMPVWTGDPGLVYAAQTSADGTAIVGVRIGRAGPAQEAGGLGQVATRRVIARAQDAVIGYQALSPVQSAAAADERGLAPLVFYHPSMERMALLDPISGRVTGLAPKSIAAAAGADGRGYYCTTPRGLVYWALPQALEMWSDQRAQPDPEVRVLAEPYVPRRVRVEGRTLLIGPSRDAVRLTVAVMELVGGKRSEISEGRMERASASSGTRTWRAGADERSLLFALHSLLSSPQIGP